ncbi:MAG TPA: phosphatidylcholine/phosphatidylserine synthase [Stellaceae bacterium]|nr:phosphatidylcholine/phosphatidylserine synthase [Stellaceae bacterium]
MMRQGGNRHLIRRPDRRRMAPISGLSINRMIPNMLTLLALCAGMTAIRVATDGSWETAVAAILIAGVLDGLDGRVARLLKSTSTFGAQLDSLSDFICFGVAPAFVLYLWTMHSMSSLGWPAALLFGVCSSLRLARFNTQLTVADPPAYAAKFFTGIPAPAAAGLALMPMVATFKFGESFFRWPIVSVVLCVAIALMMVSRVPTFSFKKVRVQHEYVAPLLVVVALMAAFLTTEPWLTLLLVGIVYICLIPFSVRTYLRDKAAHAAATAAAATGGIQPVRNLRPVDNEGDKP